MFSAVSCAVVSQVNNELYRVWFEAEAGKTSRRIVMVTPRVGFVGKQAIRSLRISIDTNGKYTDISKRCKLKVPAEDRVTE